MLILNLMKKNELFLNFRSIKTGNLLRNTYACKSPPPLFFLWEYTPKDSIFLIFLEAEKDPLVLEHYQESSQSSRIFLVLSFCRPEPP